MWPTLLNLTRDDCRRTLRRLELEAYSNMIDVFRAQGALEDNRKKILEELRAVLHISNDRHSAEARRVANDELLATIAEQLAGPNTGLGWICEGRRRIPLMPRGIPQTMYTEIADKAAEAFVAENKERLEKLSEKKHEETNTNDDDMEIDETVESPLKEEIVYPPVAMEDQAIKIWEEEQLSRKRKVPETGSIPDDSPPPVKNVRNITPNTSQKYLNLSQLYSKFSQPATNKPSGQSKHSYNQVSKVSTSKSNSGQPQKRGQNKQRAPRQKHPGKIVVSKAQMKKAARKEIVTSSPSKQFPAALKMELQAAPNSFQASYAKSLIGVCKDEQPELSAAAAAPAPPELSAPPDPAPHLAPHPAPPPSIKHAASGKPCQLIIKKRGDHIPADKKIQMTDVKILQKPNENIKVLSNRPVVLTNSAHKHIGTPSKLVATKVIGPVGKPTHSPVAVTDKMIVVSKPPDQSIANSKIVMSSSVSTPSSTVSRSSVSPRVGETITAKGIPATDIKVSAAKTFLLNPKSGQKMVVVPARARTKPGPDGQQLPLIQFKGMPTAMRLLPVSAPAAPAPPAARPSPVTVVAGRGSAHPTPPKVVSVEPIKTANMADIVPVKGLTPLNTPKTSKPIVRPASAKGNVIVVQKGATIGKALSFTKNGNDMSKIIMGKNVNQLLQAKQDQADAKGAGNVIVLELNNDQAARTTTMSEILDSRATNPPRLSDTDKKETPKITEDTPVLFDTQITDETCNASSLDSTAESIGDIAPESAIPSIAKEDAKANFSKDQEGAKDSSSVTDWEMELETVTRKGKDDDKLNSLHLDLGMSSDSDSDYIGESQKAKSKHTTSMAATIPLGVTSSQVIYETASGLSHATRTLLSQLQDEGSSSNDSSFALKSKEKAKDEAKCDHSLESEALNKAKEKLTEKVAKSQLKRIDIYSTAISSSDINLDAFSYLDEGMMAGDEEPRRAGPSLDEQLSRLLADDSQASTDSQTVSDSSPTTKP
ncbi:hypothetical protein JYU34_002275 [Plutella xylostella]|uniref:ENT domain-containing protein n=1 Tax=Plutella xylostella TaxID=51655 RepID=A0ABQ7R1Q8_PLUXY|nr:hypothetical protein JYU34_002275 [Plutella xylostella]